MEDKSVILHEFLLLFLNLAQMKQQDRIVDIFQQAWNGYDLGIKLDYSNESGAENSCEEIATRNHSFGFFILRTAPDQPDSDTMPLARNLIRLLAVILENLQRETLLENERLELEKKVESRVAEIRHKQVQLETAQVLGKIGSWDLDVVNNELIWTDESYRILGVPTGTPLTYELFLGRVHPEDREVVDRKWNAAMRSEQEYDVEHRLLMDDGEVKWVRQKADLVFDENGQCVRGSGFAQDITERKKSQKALLENEERFRKALDSSPFPVAVVDENDDRIFFWSRSAIDLFGHNPASASEWYALAYPDPDYQQEVIAQWVPALEKARQSGQAVDAGEYRVTCADGSIRVCEIYARFIDDYLIVTLHDITERKRMEEERKNAREFMQTVIDSLPETVMVINRDRTIALANRTARMMAGDVDPVAAALKCHQISHGSETPCDSGSHICPMKRVVETKAPVVVEHVHRDDQGEEIVVEVSAAPIFGADGEVVQIIESGRDVTDRKKAEIALQTSRDYIYEIANSIGDIVLSVGIPERKIEWINDSIRSIGYDPDECIGESTSLFYPDEEAFQNFGKVLKEAVAENRDVLHTENVLKKKNGESFDAEITVSFHKVDHEIVSVIAVLRDITERKQMELERQQASALLEQRVKQRTAELQARKDEAETLNRGMINLLEDLQTINRQLEQSEQTLQQTNRELESFSYSVSHDLRAPLRHIDGFVRQLLKRGAGQMDETSARYLETIAESSDRMGHLIDDLLALSRTGRAAMKLQQTDGNKIVQDVIHEHSPATENRRIVWEIEDLPPVIADRALLRQVWDNLIGNALKYTRNREEVRIEIGTVREGCDAEDGEIVFYIRDNGAGFDPHYIHKLFGVFQRLHRNDEFEGTGIGLATAQRIILRHGGRIWAEGKIDEGATFYFTLKGAQK